MVTRISNKHQNILQKLIRLPIGLKKIKDETTRESGFKFLQDNIFLPNEGYKLIAPEGREKDPMKIKGNHEDYTKLFSTSLDVFWYNGAFHENSVINEALKTKSTVKKVKENLMPEILELCDSVYEHVFSFAEDAQKSQKYHMEVRKEQLYSSKQYEVLTKDLPNYLPQKNVLITTTTPEVGVTYFFLFEEVTNPQGYGKEAITIKVKGMLYFDKKFALIPTEHFQTRAVETFKAKRDGVLSIWSNNVGWFEKNCINPEQKRRYRHGSAELITDYLLSAMYYLRCLNISQTHPLIPKALVETSGVEPGVIKENLKLKSNSDLMFEPKWKYTTIVLRDVNPEHKDGPICSPDPNKPKVGRAYHAVNMHPRKTQKGYTMVRAHFRGDVSMGVIAHEYEIKTNGGKHDNNENNETH